MRGRREAYSNRDWSYDGGGDYWDCGPHDSIITGTITESGEQVEDGHWRWEDELDANGAWQTLSGTGNGHTTQEDVSGFSGGADYTDGDLTGHVSEGGDDYSWAELCSTYTLGTDGEWIITGNGNSSGNGEGTCSCTECTHYTRYIDDDLTIEGDTTSSQRADYSYTYNTEGILHADGTYSFTCGSAHDEASSQNDFCYSADGSYDFCDGYEDVQDTSCSGEYTPGSECASWWWFNSHYDHTFEQTWDKSYSESGGHGTESRSSAEWTLDSAGNWQPCSSSACDSGYSRACYSFVSEHGQSEHTTCTWEGDSAYNGPMGGYDPVLFTTPRNLI